MVGKHENIEDEQCLLKTNEVVLVGTVPPKPFYHVFDGTEQ